MVERLKITIKNLRLEIEGPAGPVVDTLKEFLASLTPESDKLSLQPFPPGVINPFTAAPERPKSGSFRVFG